MTVEPGFGGQAFMPEMMAKVDAAAAYREKRGLGFRIEVDGGIDAATGPLSIRHGADTLVAGTFVFKAASMADAVRSVRGG
jgi:ribulose-phosphate 3-epimerase